MRGFFITGTDTGVGKTTMGVHLLKQFNQEGLRTLGLKPVASGSEQTPEGLRNEDALLLQAASSIQLDYTQVNPFAFAPAIAPHIAAKAAGIELSVSKIARHCQQVIESYQPDVVIVEGAGGWQVPLNDQESFADLAIALDFPVILVVAIRLGCINHALLSWQVIQSTALPFAGWIANCMVPDMPVIQDNIDTLTHWLQTSPKLIYKK